MNKLFKLDLPVPIKVCKNVGLLIFGFDTDQKNKIEKSLINNGNLEGISYYYCGNPADIKIETLHNEIISKEN